MPNRFAPLSGVLPCHLPWVFLSPSASLGIVAKPLSLSMSTCLNGTRGLRTYAALLAIAARAASHFPTSRAARSHSERATPATCFSAGTAESARSSCGSGVDWDDGDGALDRTRRLLSARMDCCGYERHGKQPRRPQQRLRARAVRGLLTCRPASARWIR